MMRVALLLRNDLRLSTALYAGVHVGYVRRAYPNCLSSMLYLSAFHRLIRWTLSCLLRLHHVPHFLSIVSGTYVTCILSYLRPNCAFANKPYFILRIIFSFTLMIRSKTSRPRLFDLQNPQRLQSFPFSTTKHVLPKATTIARFLYASH